MIKSLKKPIMGVLLLFITVFFNTNLKAQTARFQALYIYNICRFVDWPPEFKSGDFVIGIVGNNPDLEASLKTMFQSKKIQERKVLVKQIANPSQSSECNIVFISEGHENKIPTYLSSSLNSLYISESTNAIKKGSDINFFIDGNKLKFELGKTNLSKKQLKTSSELKELATAVY